MEFAPSLDMIINETLYRNRFIKESLDIDSKTFCIKRYDYLLYFFFFLFIFFKKYFFLQNYFKPAQFVSETILFFLKKIYSLHLSVLKKKRKMYYKHYKLTQFFDKHWISFGALYNISVKSYWMNILLNTWFNN